MKVELDIEISEYEMKRLEEEKEIIERRLEDLQGFKTAYEVYTEKFKKRDGKYYLLTKLKLRYLDTCIDVHVWDLVNPDRYENKSDGRKEELEFLLSMIGVSQEELHDIESKAIQVAKRILHTPGSKLGGMGYARERV